MRAIQMTEFGGPEVLRLVELATPEPSAGEVLIRVTRAGVNFADVHTRTNSYVRKATLPLIPGAEVAGVREDTGARVVALTGTGGYAQYAVAPAEHVFEIPEGVDDGTALALLVQGTTAWHMYRTAAHVGEGIIRERAGGDGEGEQRDAPREGGGEQRDAPREGGGEQRDAPREGGGEQRDAPREGGGEQRDAPREGGGETVVVHAAAGGVGSLAVQLGHPLGAGRVIATASSEEKRALALRLGADAAVDPAPEGLTERLLEANGGRPVDVVFEMAGGEVFDASYRALAPFGRLVVCGIASQQPNEVRSGSLLRHSRAVVGFYIFHCLERPGMFEQALEDLFARVVPSPADSRLEGPAHPGPASFAPPRPDSPAHPRLEVVVGHTYPLEEAPQAHIDLRERRTTGKLLLDPSA